MPSKDPVLAEIVKILTAPNPLVPDTQWGDLIDYGHIHDYVWEGDE